MKTRKKIFIGIIIFFTTIIIAGIILIQYISKRPLTSYEEDITLKGLKSEVKVYRDEYAIPHIYAENEHDLYCAVGYVMAQDRLWQMDLLRRATTGQLAEIFGEDLIDSDLLLRSLRSPEKSEYVMKNSSPKLMDAIEAFASGVNQFIESHKNNLPIEFTLLGYQPDKWEPVHSVNLIGYMAWDLAMSWQSEAILYKIAQKTGSKKANMLYPDLSEQKSVTFPYFKLDSTLNADTSELAFRYDLQKINQSLEKLGLGVFYGSNNWAVAGSKTKSGKPMLANDMHLGLFAPGLWYQIHQVVPGKLDVSGVILPGQPLIICGHNQNIAWGMTNVMIDDLDFYKETIHPDNPNLYKLDSEWKEMEIKNEKIKLPDGEIVEKKIRFTHRGPIVSQHKNLKNTVISMRWMGNEKSNELKSVYLLNRAENWQDFKAALKSFKSISQNIAFADTKGNIGLFCAAGIPKRKGNPALLLPGETSEFDWQGIVPFDSLPYVYNPECGFIASANSRTIGPDYPYYISYWFDLPQRYNRIREMLKERNDITTKDFKNIQNDNHSLLAKQMLPTMITEMEKVKNLLSEHEAMLNKLKKWQGNYLMESSEALFFEQFYLKYMENLLQDEMTDSLYKEFISSKILVRNIVNSTWNGKYRVWCDNVNTPEKENFHELINTSFVEAYTELEKKFGKNTEKWKWGKVHQLTLAHPMSKVKILDFLFGLSSKTYPVPGSFHTVGVYSYKFTNPFSVHHGASHRHIYTLDDWNNSETVIPTGISGIPASKHYCDQTKMYVNGHYHKDHFNETSIEKNAAYQMKFLPVK